MVNFITLLIYNDCGKTLLREYLKRYNDIFFNYNMVSFSKDKMVGFDINKGKLAEYPEQQLRFWVLNYKGQVLQDIVNRNLDRQKLEKIFRKLTNSKNVLLYGRFKEFHYYNIEKAIVMHRDARACWMVTEHRKITYLKNYVKGFKDTLKLFFASNRKKDMYVMRFEDLISDTRKYMSEVQSFLGLDGDLGKPAKRYSKYFTELDLWHLNDFLKFVKQDELDYISEELREYNEFFGYEEHMKIEDFLPETFDNDLRDFITRNPKKPWETEKEVL